MFNRLLIAFLIVICVTAAFTEISCGRLKNLKGSISGTVYMDGRPASGTIIVRDKDGNYVSQTRTNLNGHFQIKDLAAGTYKLQFLNMQGVPWGGEHTVEVRLGRFEVVNLEIKASDRIVM